MKPGLCQRDWNRGSSCVIDAAEQGFLPRYWDCLDEKTPKQQEKEPWYEEAGELQNAGRMSKWRADHALWLNSTAAMGGAAMCRISKITVSAGGRGGNRRESPSRLAGQREGLLGLLERRKSAIKGKVRFTKSRKYAVSIMHNYSNLDLQQDIAGIYD